MSPPVGGRRPVPFICNDCDIILILEDADRNYETGSNGGLVVLCENCAQARWEAQEERKMEDQP